MGESGARVQRQQLAAEPQGPPGVRRLARESVLAKPAPETATAAAQGQGAPLQPDVRREFEHRLGHDFGSVRVHTGNEADRATAALNASGFTLGRNVVFGGGVSDQSSPVGRQILAHELRHVVQQARFLDHQLGGAPVLDASHPSEHEARAEAGPLTPLAAPAVQLAPPGLVSAGQHASAARAEDAEKRIGKLEAQVAVLQKKTTAIDVLGRFRDTVLARAAGWEETAINVGSAYAIAAARHRLAIDKDKAAAAIGEEVMMAILVGMAVGAFGWVVGEAGIGEAQLLGPELEHASHGGLARVLAPGAGSEVEALISGPAARGEESLFMYQPQRVFESSPRMPREPRGPASFPNAAPASASFAHAEEGSPFKEGAAHTVASFVELSGKLGGEEGEAVSGDPQVFQNERVAAVKRSVRSAHEYFANFTGLLETLPESSWTYYDPSAQAALHARWLAHAKLLGTAPPGPTSIEQMAQEIERAFWAKWAREQHPRAVYTALTTEYPRIGDHMEDRLKVLGIDKAAGMQFTGTTWFTKGHLFDDSESDDWYAFAAWGASFVPKQFFPDTPSD